MRRRLAIVLLALALIVAAAPAEAASAPWSGYRIKRAPTADGGFMGGRKVDGRVAYLLDAGARGRTGGYRRVHRVAGDRGSARAAWILSKYGAVQVADQSAAVDVATYALVSHRPLGGARARARLRSTGHAASIRALARYMLSESKKYAGPYTLTVESAPSQVGGRVAVTARFTSYAGLPVAGLPVLFRIPGTAETHETSARGQASTSFPADEVGLRPLVVGVSKVPEWRLRVRRPDNPRASRVALAGHKTRLVAHRDIAVRATPAVTVSASAATQEVAKPFTGTFTITGSEGAEQREVSASLYGPFPQGAAVSCGGTPLRSVRSVVQGDGTYRTPATTVAAAGVYTWRVQVGANQLNAPAQACGGAVRLRTKPTIRLDAIPGSKLSFAVGGLPAGYADEAVLTMFGPYRSRAAATCVAGKRVGSVGRQVNHSGTFTSPRVATAASGFYTWRARLPAGYLVVGQVTGCGAAGSFVKVP